MSSHDHGDRGVLRSTIPNPLTPTFRVLSLCSGLGALDLALAAFGGQTVCYVEKNPNARLVLESRMVTHDLDYAPIEHDVQTFNLIPRHLVPTNPLSPLIVAGGIPCQGNSIAGGRKGSSDERNLWPAMARIVSMHRPELVLLENVRGLLSVNRSSDGKTLPKMFGSILADLHDRGYDAVWTTRLASEAGAPHKRDRVFLLGIRRPRLGTASHVWLQEELRERLSILHRRFFPTVDSVYHYRPVMALDPEQSEALTKRAWPWPRTVGLHQHPGEVARLSSREEHPRERLGRGPRLQMLGNAVVPQQAVLAVESILAFCYGGDGTIGVSPGEAHARVHNTVSVTKRDIIGKVKLIGASMPFTAGRRALRSWSPAGMMCGGLVRLLSEPLQVQKNRCGLGLEVEEGKGEALWPTPDAAASNIHESFESFEARRVALKKREPARNGNGAGTPLGIAVKQSNWTTPSARDGRRSGSYPADKNRKSQPLPALVGEVEGKSLSPTWVETLMGLPAGWTDVPKPQTPPKPAKGGTRG